MAQLICEDCGEVLEENLPDDDAGDAADALNARDEREHEHDHEGDEIEDDASGGSESEETEESEGQSNSPLDERTDLGEEEDDLEDEFEEKMDEMQDADKDDDVADEAQDYSDAHGEADQDIDVEILVGQPMDVPGARWEQCQNDARAITPIYQDKLRQKRKNKEHREQRSGTFDSRRLVQADRGSTRVFKREDEGDDAEYEVYFVLDRSYSMKRTEMPQAEEATATTMAALEGAGVKTELVDFKNGTARVRKTKSQDIEEEVGHVLEGPLEADGGTPLTGVMEIVSNRIEGTEGEPFVIAVGDGKPNDEDAFKEVVAGMDAEVLGVLVGGSGRFDESELQHLFHHHVVVGKHDDLAQRLEELARGVML